MERLGRWGLKTPVSTRCPRTELVPAQVVYDEILDEYREKKNMNDIVITREWAAAGIN